MKPVIKIAVLFLVAIALKTPGQTTLIEWQTNWPACTNAGATLATNTEFALPGSSCWFSGTQSAVYTQTNATGTATNLVANIGSGSLTYWTYFAASNTPVSLGSNTALRVSVTFFSSNTVTENGSRGLRVAVLYAGTNNGVGQTYWGISGTSGTYIPSGTPRQTNYWGYSQNLDYGTTFGTQPLQTYAFTNNLSPLFTDALLSKTADGIQIGGNGGGTTNDTGFVDFTNYTLVMTISNISPTNITITTTISGYGLSNSVDRTAGYISQTVQDTNYCYTNFDTVAFRPAANTSVASMLTITSLKVEKMVASTTLPAPFLTNSVSGGNLNLSWGSNYLGYWLQSNTNLLTGGWIDVAGSSTVTSLPIPIRDLTPAIFYRLSSVP